ncbi:MAG TPA: rod shape-determining protein MreD, partial [Gemmatimonadales bacterium]|nr:rod shape-determining protein MreD [Gemmatimonadales bacterium]
MSARRSGWRAIGVFLVLLVLQFYLRPRLGSPRYTPDFLAIGVLLFALRAQPGQAAIAGLCAGLLTDALTPARFGAGMLAHATVGYLAAWGRSVFFADNLLVTMGFFAVGTWLRNALVLLASGSAGGSLLTELGVWSTVQALSTAVAGVVIAVLLRGWLDLRIRE